jgi:hypothetical protein
MQPVSVVFVPQKIRSIVMTTHWGVSGDPLLAFYYNYCGLCSLAQALPRPQLIFSFQNLVFWNLFEFSVAETTFKSIPPTFWIQFLPRKFH